MMGFEMYSWGDELMLIRQTSGWGCVKLDWIERNGDGIDALSYRFFIL